MHYSWLQRILLYKSPVVGYLIFYTTGMSSSFVHIDKHLEIISKSEVAFLTSRVCSIKIFFYPNLFAKSSCRKNLKNEGITPRSQVGANWQPGLARKRPNLVMPISVYTWAPAVFALPLTWIVATETIWPTKPVKYLLSSF